MKVFDIASSCYPNSLRSCLGISILIGSLLCGCSTQLNSRQTASYRSDLSIDEIRLELADVKHELKSTQVELNLLDERVKKEATVLASTAKQSVNSALSGSTTAQLEARIASIEKLLEKTTADLRTLSTHANQALAKLQSLEQEVFSHEKRLDEVAKLKGTLTSISQAIGQPTASPTSTKSYRVKAGDSLEKIARNHKVSLASLKNLNHLKNDKIVVGQELRIPDDNS